MKEVYTPQRPTLVVTGASGQTKIVRKVYGALKPGQKEQEQREVQYRAEQLDPRKIEKPRERVFYIEEDE